MANIANDVFFAALPELNQRLAAKEFSAEDLARAFAARLKAQPDFELLVEPMCNILCFRHIPRGAKRETLNVALLNEHQAKIRQRVLASGKFFLVQTRIGEALYLRCTLMNPHTTEQDMVRLLELIRDCATD